MGDFFRGWRRKIGCVTLVMACVFMAAWLRSPLNRARFHFEFGSSFLTFASNQNGMWWVTSELPGSFYQPNILGDQSESWSLPGRRMPFSADPFRHLENWSWQTEERWDWRGFYYGRYCDERPNLGIHLTFKIIPHWAVLLPLTFVSAYLLLSKPRNSTQKTITEPIANEGE